MSIDCDSAPIWQWLITYWLFTLIAIALIGDVILQALRLVALGVRDHSETKEQQ